MCGSLEKRGDGDRQRDRQTETDLDLRVLSDSFGAVGPKNNKKDKILERSKCEKYLLSYYILILKFTTQVAPPTGQYLLVCDLEFLREEV